MIKKKCKDCGKGFDVNPNARFPRKYCEKCGLQRKKDYENIHLIEADDCEDE